MDTNVKSNLTCWH